MKKFSLIVLLGASAWAQAATPTPQPIAVVSTTTVENSTRPFVLSSIKNDAFWEGEKLNFVIKYEFIQAGTAVMNVGAGSLVDNRPTFHIETKAESSGMVDKFFKVRDFNSSVVDRASMMSRNMHQNLKEGGYSVLRNTAFDYTQHRYTFERTRRGTLTKHEGNLQGPVMDALGAFFYARTLDLHPGDEISIAVFSDEEMYPLNIKVSTKVETISVPAGKFECIMIEPLTEGDAIFKASDGKMQIWLTNDEYKMPILIRSKVFIGSFDAELQSYERPHKPTFDTSETK